MLAIRVFIIIISVIQFGFYCWYYFYLDPYLRELPFVFGMVIGALLAAFASVSLEEWRRGTSIAAIVVQLFAVVAFFAPAFDMDSDYGEGIGMAIASGAVLIVVGPALVSVVLLIFFARRNATPFHVCSQCGYDLRGTLWAGRDKCPECGHPIERKAGTEVPAKDKISSS